MEAEALGTADESDDGVDVTVTVAREEEVEVGFETEGKTSKSSLIVSPRLGFCWQALFIAFTSKRNHYFNLFNYQPCS